MVSVAQARLPARVCWHRHACLRGFAGTGKRACAEFYDVRIAAIRSGRKSSVSLVAEDFLHRRRNMRSLRQDHIFQLGMIRAEAVHRRHTLHRSVKLVK